LTIVSAISRGCGEIETTHLRLIVLAEITWISRPASRNVKAMCSNLPAGLWQLSPAADMPLNWLSSESRHVWTAPAVQGKRI
jgi:hypothetical protein